MLIGNRFRIWLRKLRGATQMYSQIHKLCEQPKSLVFVNQYLGENHGSCGDSAKNYKGKSSTISIFFSDIELDGDQNDV